MPDIGHEKTFIVISGDNATLGEAVSMSLLASKAELHQLFGGSAMPSWKAVTSHMPARANAEEIATVLHGNNRPMMVLSGYRNTDEWNRALTEYMFQNALSATLVIADGSQPPEHLRALFKKPPLVLPPETDLDLAVDLVRHAVKETRYAMAVPLGTAPARLLN